MYTNENKAGLVFGAFVGGLHIIWSLLVFLGWGQSLVNFITWAHMVQVQHIVLPFDISAAATLVVFSAVVAYVVGYLFAIVWNTIHK